jgi:amphi-Trp domain-containing protein
MIAARSAPRQQGHGQRPVKSRCYVTVINGRKQGPHACALPLRVLGKDGGMSEELIETTTETVLRREEAASRLRQLADQISRHNQIEFEREGMRYSVRIPDEVTLKLEIEIGDESEIEIELSW